MGNTISRQAARDRIMEDIATTIIRAEARAAEAGGGTFAAASSRLGPVQTVYRSVLDKRDAAAREAAPLIALRNAKNDRADDLIKATSDNIWNEVGRPRTDPVFEVLFPEGSAIYTDARIDDQPDLMRLLAELLESGLHPKIAAESASTKAAAVRAAADDLQQAVDAASGPQARVALFDRALGAIAKAAQVELSNLKRFWKSDGLSETDVHSIIPDRPRTYGVAKPGAPSPDSPEPTPDSPTT